MGQGGEGWQSEGVLGSGATPAEALADLRAARRAMIEALLAEGYPVPEPTAVTV